MNVITDTLAHCLQRRLTFAAFRVVSLTLFDLDWLPPSWACVSWRAAWTLARSPAIASRKRPARPCIRATG